MQRKDGSNLLILSLEQFHKSKEELFSFYGETLLKRNPGTSFSKLSFCIEFEFLIETCV